MDSFLWPWNGTNHALISLYWNLRYGVDLLQCKKVVLFLKEMKLWWFVTVAIQKQYTFWKHSLSVIMILFLAFYLFYVFLFLSLLELSVYTCCLPLSQALICMYHLHFKFTVWWFEYMTTGLVFHCIPHDTGPFSILKRYTFKMKVGYCVRQWSLQ